MMKTNKTNNPDIHPETIKMSEYLRAIIAAGSVHPTDVEFLSSIRCRQRRNNRRCTGKIRITSRVEDIEWQCARCGINGTITGWRGCDFDMSEFAIASDATGMLMLYAPENEYRALQDILMYTPAQDALVAGAVWTGDEVLITASRDDFDTLVGDLAFEVNHSRGRKQIVLNDLRERIERLVERAGRR